MILIVFYVNLCVCVCNLCILYDRLHYISANKQKKNGFVVDTEDRIMGQHTNWISKFR